MESSAPFRRNPVYERWRWQIFAITWLAYVGFYLTRKGFAVAKIQLADSEVMGWTIIELSWIEGAYAITYALGQFVWGVCGDRYGTRRVIIIGMLCSVVTAVLLGASSTVVLFGVLFGVQGLCQSAGWAPLIKNVGNFFSRHERGRMLGAWYTNYALGSVIASILAGFAADRFGWRYAFWIPAATLLLIWVLFILFQRDRPADLGLPPIEEYHGQQDALVNVNEAAGEAPEGSWLAVREVVTNKMVMLLSLIYFLLKPIRYLIMSWSPLYINEKLGTGVAESGILGSMFDLAGPFSVFFGGYMSDKVFRSKRMPMSVIALFGIAILLFFFESLPETKLALGLGFFGVGFLLYIPDSLVSGTAAVDFGTAKGASTASGFINGWGSLGAILGLTLPGLLVAYLGPGVYIWNYIFVGLSAAAFIAGCILLPKWNALPATADGK